MKRIIIEIKAVSSDLSGLRKKLDELNAEYKGVDHQIDTYFQVKEGRLKCRQGNIENTLIYYKRANQAGPKLSNVNLYKPGQNPSDLVDLLREALGIKVIVDKKRHILFVGNVKFHLDEVKGLGTFVEIEAIESESFDTREKLLEQCEHYMKYLGIRQEDLITHSYSDLLIKESI